MGGAAPGGRGGREPGARGAEGLEVVSESEYEPIPWSSAPVSMPPLVFFNLGIPPAKSPPSCGAASLVLAAAPPPVSLLLRFLFELEGIAGASPPGGLIPGTGGAPLIGPLELGLSATIGADLSLVTVDFNFLPLLISDSNAPYHKVSVSVYFALRICSSSRALVRGNIHDLRQPQQVVLLVNCLRLALAAVVAGLLLPFQASEVEEEAAVEVHSWLFSSRVSSKCLLLIVRLGSDCTCTASSPWCA